MGVGEKTVVADSDQAARYDVEQVSSDEVIGGERLAVATVVALSVPEAEADVVGGDPEDPPVADGNAVGVAS